MSLVSRIYKWRGKAVMSHYAKCRFNELLAVLLFFLAIAIICFMMYLRQKVKQALIRTPGRYIEWSNSMYQFPLMGL